jgi:MscS family membrane protein
MFRALTWVLTLACAPLWAQLPTHPCASSAAQPEAPKDALGRDTPRGTVLGFLAAARKGNMETASQFLDTPLRGPAAALLAQQLFTVLDRRLPPQLQKLSDNPEGSLSDLSSDQDAVGTISSAQGDVEILVERKTGKSGSIWLFSRKSLARIPDLYQETNAPAIDSVLPPVLVNTKFAGIALFEWLAVLLGLPAAYFFTVFLNRIISPLIGSLRRHLRNRADLPNPEIVPVPVRLLMIAFVIYWVLSDVTLPLLARQFWTSTASILMIAASVWLVILLNGRVEHYIRQRLVHSGNMGAASVVRLGRRVFDSAIVFTGLLFSLYHFGLNPTAALAGLGVGGIAVALAAQKTLENVLSGISIIFDKAMCVGDTLKVGDTQGTVEDIGLRSTLIRTRDRTLVSVPNGQIANLKLENLSARDKFWFHPLLSLRYDTTTEQMESAVRQVGRFLVQHSHVEPGSTYVRFLQFGRSSMDLDISAYVLARDWNHFLEMQGELLLSVREIVESTGAEIAIQPDIYGAPSTLPAGR